MTGVTIKSHALVSHTLLYCYTVIQYGVVDTKNIIGLKQLDSVIFSFIWDNKPSHISKAHLQKEVRIGALRLPAFKHYYLAANGALGFCQWDSLDND